MHALRRLFSLCLMLAFASFGMIAAAPAHAHSEQGSRGAILHSIGVYVGQTSADHDHHHVHGEHADSDTSGGEDKHGGFHVHAVSAFTTVDEPAGIGQPLAAAPVSWVDRPAVAVSNLVSPLKKPPRTAL
jgi:hypothetical protein